jgi:hypothetical protein
VHPCKPKAPNFLRVEEGSETEKVDLRHEVVNDPKVALRKAVKRLARAQKRNQASAGDWSDIHHQK